MKLNVKVDAEIRGKFIQLTGNLMNATPEHLQKANEYLLKVTGLEHHELDPEEFYATEIWNEFMNIYGEAIGNVDEAVVKLGKRIYPTIKRTVGFPEHLKTPLDYVKFEADGYWQAHQGSDVMPRKIMSEGANHVTMFAPAPGYNEKLYVGVWLGILEMIGITSGKVEELGDHTYKISW